MLREGLAAAAGKGFPAAGAGVFSAARVRASFSLAGADASKGARSIRGTAMPSSVSVMGSGIRSTAWGATRSAISATGAEAATRTGTMPTPRTSI